MKLPRRQFLHLAAGAAALPAVSRVAWAQTYPTRPITMIVPAPAGGPTDSITRILIEHMRSSLGQPIVIENGGGAGGTIAVGRAARANPDGYTIAITSAGALAISPSLEKVAYDTLRDLAPVTLVATVPEILVVPNSVPAQNLAELIALAKAQPGKLNFASTGPGSLPHLAGELLKLTAQIDIAHVPYRGAAPAINDLLGQQVQMTFLDLPAILGVALFSSFFIVLFQTIVDVLYARLDPRIKPT